MGYAGDQPVEIRPAAEEDCEFAYQVKKAAEGDLVRRFFGWDEAVQRDFHLREWAERPPGIIRFEGKTIGTVDVRVSDGCIDVGRFFIQPEYQNRGIGSRILRRVTQRADEGDLVARLAFLRGNRAEALYGRHGFRMVSQTETHCHMERRPQRSGARTEPLYTPDAVAGQVVLVLRTPVQDEEEEFLRAHSATSPRDPNFLHFYKEGMALRQYLEVLAARERGTDLPPGEVPSTFLFAFVSGRIVGRVSIRHSLNGFLERLGGHIGYVVVPEFRRRGYATAILRQGLGIASGRLSIRRVLVTCDDDNLGSIRTIEKCGGVLEEVVTGPDLQVPKRRYWIDTDEMSFPESWQGRQACAKSRSC
jgi:predicted acetyltransferase/N-acetylglutamate synthase-like GNAT family acetyltransferase